MKATLICPDRTPSVALLAETGPLAVAPLLGKNLVEYWVEHLVALGIAEILVVAPDRPAQVRSVVGDGTRWGLPITVESVATSATSTENPAQIVVQMDHLPGPGGLPLLTNYAAWFAALQAWMPHAQKLERIGQCEVRPGIWVGLRTRLDPAARLQAPCWLGNHVTVNADAVIGPWAILEDGVVVGAGARIVQSVIGPATFVGAKVRVEHSIVQHHHLINWATDSYLYVPGAFWLSSLRPAAVPARPKPAPSLMKITHDRDRLRIAAIGPLGADHAVRFRREVQAALTSQVAVIEIDLAGTDWIDSSGLAMLCGLHRSAGDLGISLLLLHPQPAVRQLLALTQTDQLLGLDQAEPQWPGTPRPAITRFAAVPAH